MERIGLINRLIQLAGATYEAESLVEQSKEHQFLQENRKIILNFLKDIGGNKDIPLTIAVESVLLHLELQNRANSPEETNSIKTALLQLEEAQKSLAVVKDSAAYTAVAETYSSKRKEAGLPLDSFREFLKSHTTRLTNRLAGPLSVPEKNILRQRKENLRVVKELYVTMQRKALGMRQERSQGQKLER